MSKPVSDLQFADCRVGLSDSMEIPVSVDQIDQFAGFSGDYSPVHVDEVFAKERGMRGRIAHGLLVGAFVSGFIGTRLPGKWGVLQSVTFNFRKPLIPPDTIKITGEITGVHASVGQIVLAIKVQDSAGSVIAQATARSIMPVG